MQQKPILGQGAPEPDPAAEEKSVPETPAPAEIGGRQGSGPDRLDPTRYGDWEKNGRCIDF